MNHDLMAAQAASEIVELLTLCQDLQSEKDGRRPPHTPAMRMRMRNVSVPHAGTPCCCAGCFR